LDGWQYECDGANATVLDTGRSARELVDAAEAFSHAAEKEGATAVRQRTKIRGMDADVVLTKRPGGLFHWAVIIKFPVGVRSVTCSSRGSPDGCAAILDSIVAVEWRGGPAAGALASQGPTLNVGGRRVTVPPSCTGRPRPRGGRIECPDTSNLDWVEVDDEAAAANTERLMAEVLAAKMGVERLAAARGKVECRIAGVPTTCTRVNVRTEGRKGSFYWGTVVARSRPVFATCWSIGEVPFSGPCSLAFEVR
jgi:hypothetical protein